MIDKDLVTEELLTNYGQAMQLQEKIRSHRISRIPSSPEVIQQYLELREEINEALGIDSLGSPLDAHPLTEYEDSKDLPEWKLLQKWGGWLSEHCNS